MVLLHHTQLEQSHSHKLTDRWLGPYKVIDATRNRDRGTYRFAELDGAELERLHSGDRLTKFAAR
jgi:hypothetical protein